MMFCKDIKDCMERVKGYCEKQRTCTHCCFNDNGECVLEDRGIPATWQMPEKHKLSESD